MVSNLIQISICATSLTVIAALGQYPLLAQTSSINTNSNPVETTDDGIESEKNTLPNSSIEQTGGISSAPVASYVEPYTNVLAGNGSQSPRRRKIPEPSALIGLMAIAGCVAMQRKTKKI